MLSDAPFFVYFLLPATWQKNWRRKKNVLLHSLSLSSLRAAVSDKNSSAHRFPFRILAFSFSLLSFVLLPPNHLGVMSALTADLRARDLYDLRVIGKGK